MIITAARAVDREFVYIVVWRSGICVRARTLSWHPFDPFGFAVDPSNSFTYVKLMFVGPNINFTYMKSMFVTQISIFPTQNPTF